MMFLVRRGLFRGSGMRVAKRARNNAETEANGAAALQTGLTASYGGRAMQACLNSGPLACEIRKAGVATPLPGAGHG